MITVRLMFEYVLIELNKVKAPSILVEDFNYFFNKGIYQFVNKVYNLYELNQQTSDEIRALRVPVTLTPTLKPGSGFNAYSADLPIDYYHILNCVCEFKPIKDFKCYKKDEPVQFSARRMTSDMWPQLLNNFYLRPIYKRPYYIVYNAPATPPPTPPPSGDDPGERNITTPEIAHIEIRYGADIIFTLGNVYVDYLKVPENIKLTQDQLETVIDSSQILEFPDFVCYEITNELVKLLLENSSDPRLQSNIPINQSIAPPQPTQAIQQGRSR